MLQKSGSITSSLYKALDFVLVIISFVAAYYLKWYLPVPFIRGLDITPNYYLILLLSAIISYLSFQFAGFYEPFRTQRFRDIFYKILKGVAYTVTGLVLCLFIAHQIQLSRLLIFFFAIILTFLLTISKAAIYYTLSHYRRKDFNIRKVLMVGSKIRAQEFIKAIINSPSSGYTVIGCLEIAELEYLVGTEVCCGINLIGTLDNLSELLLKETIDEVIFAIPLSEVKNASDYIKFAEELGVYVRILPDFQIQKIMYRPETAKIYFEQLVGMPTIALSTVPEVEGALLVKSFMDYLGAIIGLCILSPVFITVAVLIKLTSRGPIFFCQERVGLNGRKFNLIKFRTMVDNAEELKSLLSEQNEMDGPVFKIKDDPRITSIGKFLRKTSLDELPQLINVVRGDMSMVGPRPPLRSEVEKYEPWQRRRLSMKPGITCIWQVRGRNEIDFEEWMKLDLEYIDNWSLSLDLRILFLTVREVLVGSGR